MQSVGRVRNLVAREVVRHGLEARWLFESGCCNPERENDRDGFCATRDRAHPCDARR